MVNRRDYLSIRSVTNPEVSGDDGDDRADCLTPATVTHILL